MKLRVIVEEDGTKRLQVSTETPDWFVDVEEVPASEEWDYLHDSGRGNESPGGPR